MGIGGFLAAQAERDHYHYLHRFTALRVIRSCAGEMEREVHAVLGPVGVDQKTSREVAKCLREVEDVVRPDGDETSHGNGDVESGAMARWSKDVGLTAFLLKFGEGIGEILIFTKVCYANTNVNLQRTLLFDNATFQHSQSARDTSLAASFLYCRTSSSLKHPLPSCTAVSLLSSCCSSLARLRLE